MNKIKSTLFLAIFVATTATTTLAGHILIGGRPDLEPNKATTATIIVATEPKNEISSEISDYLWTFASIIGQLKF